MLVRNFLHKAPVTVPPECTLGEAAALMAEHGVGTVLVATGGELVGILTDRDLAVRGLGHGLPATTDVERIMTPHPAVVQGSADLVEAYRLLEEADVRRLPVLEDSELAGIVTIDDLLVGLVLELGALVSPIAAETFGRRPSTGR
jgi:CBS domain-containing protein